MTADTRRRSVAELLELRRLFDANQMIEAERLCRSILAREPNNPEALYYLGELAQSAGREQESIQILEQAISLKPHPDYFVGLAKVHAQLGDVESAVEVCDRGLEVSPRSADLLARRGQALATMGRFEEARDSMERCLEIEPVASGPHHELAALKRYTRDDPHLAQMERLLGESGAKGEVRASLCFALATAWDQLGEYDRAWEKLEEANRIMRGLSEYDPRVETANNDRIIEAFTPELIEQLEGVGHDSDRVILIVGLPRSGTTLIEQVLSAHPDVDGAGELMELPRSVVHVYPDFAPQRGVEILDALDRVDRRFWEALGRRYEERVLYFGEGAARVVDKQLFNYPMLGLLHLALPNVKVIHGLRDPMDTCFACLSKRFTRQVGYTYSQVDIGTAYREMSRLMDHWRRVLPDGTIRTVRYEDMVSDTEAQVRGLLEFLGLPWDDACLRFHEKERAVRTLSLTQVRKPIYKTSVGRWRNYEHHLGPLRETLGELVNDGPEQI